MEVYVDDDSKLTLHGLQQHYVKLKDNEKNRKLFELLDLLEFNQASFYSVERLFTKLREGNVFTGVCHTVWIPVLPLPMRYWDPPPPH